MKRYKGRCIGGPLDGKIMESDHEILTISLHDASHWDGFTSTLDSKEVPILEMRKARYNIEYITVAQNQDGASERYFYWVHEDMLPHQALQRLTGCDRPETRGP